VTPEEAARTVRATLARLGIVETVLAEVSGTMARPLERGSGAVPLPQISLDLSGSRQAAMDPARHEADLVARGELGRGGMGVVHLAEQRSLGRDVAVKTALRSDALVAHALLREARVMGSLEHPNLVPVHALGVDQAGAPVLVMKRIKGVSWRALLADPTHEGWKPLLAGHDDRMRANVEILSQVCRALAFAHDRGVVHRDLKPDNVMIGRFGEVYLLDWGVALRLAERADEPAAIVGTPGYLAPEMAQGDPTLVDVHTDVYLLGATLYEVLTGRMPHDAPTPMAALVSAVLGKIPAIAADAPPDLAGLALDAMATKPTDRVASAEAFREGLTRFLASREADGIVREARLAVSRADESITAQGRASQDAFRALIEARFGFLSALRMRPHDPDIRGALDGCLERLVERELELRSPGGARALLAELGTPSPALASRVEALERSVAEERAAADALREMRERADTSKALRTMMWLAVVFGVVGLVINGWFVWDQKATGGGLSVRGPPTPALVSSVTFLGIVLLGAFVGRRTMFANEAVRRITTLVVAVQVTNVVCIATTSALGGSLFDASVNASAAMTCVLGLGAATVLRDLWPGVLLLVVLAVASIAFPQVGLVFGELQFFVLVGAFVHAIRRQAARSRVAETPQEGPKLR
jgi:serine/threonine-protein kinase